MKFFTEYFVGFFLFFFGVSLTKSSESDSSLGEESPACVLKEAVLGCLAASLLMLLGPGFSLDNNALSEAEVLAEAAALGGAAAGGKFTLSNTNDGPASEAAWETPVFFV
jgi:hypothetical protein